MAWVLLPLLPPYHLGFLGEGFDLDLEVDFHGFLQSIEGMFIFAVSFEGGPVARYVMASSFWLAPPAGFEPAFSGLESATEPLSLRGHFAAVSGTILSDLAVASRPGAVRGFSGARRRRAIARRTFVPSPAGISADRTALSRGVFISQISPQIWRDS